MANIEKEQTIEVDPAVLANSDDDYASSGYDTSTASLSSSINQYAYENGRRYHTYFGANKNVLPTDEVEQDRLDLHHEVFLSLLERQLFKAPIGDSPHRILDVGTGTGIWAIEMAEKFPEAEVIGTDLSPIQPHWVPPNCRFEVDDTELEWTYRPQDSFDFIHIRNLAQSLTSWSKVLSQAFAHTKPGGYIELAEVTLVPYSDDNTMSPDVQRYTNLLSDAMAKLGRPRYVTGESLKTNLENAGFKDIRVFQYKQPLAPWAKDPKLKHVGAMVMMAGDTGYHAYGMAAFTRILGMDPTEADAICQKAVQAGRNKNYHVYVYYYVVYGRKPEAIEAE